jgi:hypothetical protein
MPLSQTVLVAICRLTDNVIIRLRALMSKSCAVVSPALI